MPTASPGSGNDHMSDLDQINTALERLFNEEGQRIVFWNDPKSPKGTLLFTADVWRI